MQIPKPRDKHEYRPKPRRETLNAVKREFGRKLTEVNHFVDQYRKENPGSSKKDACMAYMEVTGIIIPKPLQETESEREARLEREAIQAEQ